MKKAGTKNSWALLLLLLAGVVLGGVLGVAAEEIAALSWLNYGQSFGFAKPVVLDLGMIVLTFGVTIKITVASIFGILLAAVIYHFI